MPSAKPTETPPRAAGPDRGGPWVFLDLDGTLSDAAPGITRSIAHALSRMNLPVPDQPALERLIGPALQETFPKLGVPGGEVDRALGHYREHYAGGAMYDCRVYDGVAEMMQALRAAGFRLALATAKPIVYARLITRRLGLAAWMDDEFGSELDGRRTDKRDLLAHALAATGAAAGECFMLGDRLHDVRGALHNGVTPLGAAWGFGGRDELRAAGCAAIAEAPREIPELVESLR